MPFSESEIAALLKSHLAAQHVEVLDESASHAGHSGAASGGSHFALLVVAASFEGKTPLERHRAVYSALDFNTQESLHALRLQTFTPEEWRVINYPYGQ